MRAVSGICVALVFLVVAAGDQLRAQGGLETLRGLGELVGSFVAHDAFVGPTPLQLRRLRDGRSRLHLQGFSVDPPAGAAWYSASSLHSRATVIQTAWFVKDPHRFTSAAKRDRIPARPLSLVAKLEFYGRPTENDFPQRVKQAKTDEWMSESVQVLALETRSVRVANIPCAEYEARLLDRRAPPGFTEQPFLVTLVGRACPHPDAPWLTVDVSGARRTPEGESPAAGDATEETFVRSLEFDALGDGPIVEDVLLLDRGERPQAKSSGVWVEGTVLADGALWVSHRVRTPRTDVSRVLSRIDTASNQLTSRLAVRGAVVGVSGHLVWVFGEGAAWRLDPGAANGANEVRITCSPGVLSPFRPFHAGSYGVWLGCTSLDEGKRAARDVRGFLRRIEPLTGAPIVEVALPRPPGHIQGNLQLAWVSETTGDLRDKACRVHAIDTVANRVVRTVVMGSSACRHIVIAGDDAWMVRDVKGRDEIAKVDLVSGRIVVAIPLPKDRLALGLAVGRDLVWVSTTTAVDTTSGAQLGSLGGLVRIDRATARLTGTMLPTGTTDRMIGIEGNAVWLYDSEGAILKVRTRRAVPRE
jgi:hypothetical protein